MGMERGALWRTLTGVAVAIWGCLIVACVGIGVVFLFNDRLPFPQLAVTSAVASTPTPQIRHTATPAAKSTNSRTDAIRATATSAPTRRPAAEQTQTRAHTPSPTLTSTQGATRTPAATPTPGATRTSTPSPTRTSSPTPTSTRRSTRTPTPTPIVCDDLDEIGQLTIVPGQRFACTIGQDALTERINEQPDVPCTDVTVTMADGEIRVTCRMGVRLNAVGVVDVDDCRVSIQIVRGTIGFTQVVQALLDANTQLIPYDAICIEQAEVTDGQIEIEGHGR